jgi:hypothetical protein
MASKRRIATRTLFGYVPAPVAYRQAAGATRYKTAAHLNISKPPYFFI